MRYRFLLFLCVLSFSGKAQEDSISKHKPKLIYQLDNRGTFIVRQNIQLYGLRLGVELNKHWRLGFDYHDMIKPLVLPAPPGRDKGEIALNFRYASFWGEYVWLRTSRWEISTPLHIGYTFSGIRKNSPLHYNLNEHEKHNVLSDFSVRSQYKVYDWLGVGAGVGYRQMLDPNPIVQKMFDGPSYSLSVRVFLGKCWQKIRTHSRFFGKSAVPLLEYP